ncbi:MAG: TetR/AcrR family transcriptional regulator, partial [Steroidobacteraceae bacterium]
LSAALKCFIGHGFHAASMASIAEEAGMSAGLIYRYFENKHAIVLAIVERQLEEKREMILKLQSSEQLAADLFRFFDAWSTPQSGAMSVALMLEMSAEATRNPQIAAALTRADELTRSEFREWLARPRAQGGLGLAEAEAKRRGLEVRLVVDGLAVRAAREPRIDRADLKAAIDSLIQRVLA